MSSPLTLDAVLELDGIEDVGDEVVAGEPPVAPLGDREQLQSITSGAVFTSAAVFAPAPFMARVLDRL